MNLQEVLSRLDQDARELFQRNFLPITTALQRSLERGISRAESVELLEQLKNTYVRIVTVTAQTRIPMQPENRDYYQGVMEKLIHQGHSTVFDGLQRAINIAYEGRATSKRRALNIFKEEVEYLIEEKLAP